MSQRAFKTALVLSGGSARGLAHVGALDEMEKNGLDIDMVVGTSIGAVVGGLYAYHRDISPVISKMRMLLESEVFMKAISLASDEIPGAGFDGFFNRFIWLFRRGVYYSHSITRPTLVEEEVYQQIMNDLIPDYPIEDLSIPFAAVAMDIRTGEEVVITSGSLRRAVSASSAIPGILPAVEMNGRLLTDGGWVDNIPVDPAIALGAHFTIAVDASLDVAGLGPLPLSAIETLFRCNEMTRIILMRQRKSQADVVLTPEIGALSWTNFACMDRCFGYGMDAVRLKMPLIRRIKNLRKIKSLNGLRHPARSGKWRRHLVFL